MLEVARGGSRISGPPSRVVYAATAVFVDLNFRPTGSTNIVSVMLEEVRILQNLKRIYSVDFLARELVDPYLEKGARMDVYEGPKLVANATFVEML